MELLSDIEDIEDDREFENVERVRKRYIRDRQNPFEFYNDLQFKRRYRFDKNSILHGILPKIEEGLAKINNRGLPIPPVMQLLICLRYYATASFQVSSMQRKRILVASLLKEYKKCHGMKKCKMKINDYLTTLEKGMELLVFLVWMELSIVLT